MKKEILLEIPIKIEVKPKIPVKKQLSSDDLVNSNIDSNHSVSEFEPTTQTENDNKITK